MAEGMFSKPIPVPPERPKQRPDPDPMARELGEITPDMLAAMAQYGKPMPVVGGSGMLPVPDRDTLADRSFADMLRLREQYPDKLSQRLLAPYEHRAFAREIARDDPLRALSLLVAIPGYQVAKRLNLIGSRSGADNAMEQMAHGYAGLFEGYFGDKK